MSEVSDRLKEAVNWNRFFLLVNAVGNQLNDRTLRFLKSIIQDKGIARMSNGVVEYVDNIGQDHQMGPIRIETKCGTNILTTGKGKEKRTGFTGTIKLNNTLGSSDGRDLPHTFDYLMIVDTDAVAIVEFEKLFPFVTSNGDGLSAKLPYNILEWVVKPGEIDHAMFSDMNNVNVLERLHMLLDEIIDEFDK